MRTSIDRTIPAAWRWFFLVAAIYDIALGLAFLVAGESILDAIGMQLPPHIAYIQLAAVFVAVQGISYLFAWRDPLASEGLIWVGVIYKASYSGLALWYLVAGLLPSTFWVPWAVIDILFMIGFLGFLLGPARRTAA